MSEMLEDLPFVFVYLDDILIISETFEEHLEHLKIVLKRLAKQNLTINRPKSKLLAERVHYLGFIISKEGCVPDQKKIDTILELDTPRNVSDVRRLVGMVNFVRRHIAKTSALLAPINELVKTRTNQIHWTTKHQTALEKLK